MLDGRLDSDAVLDGGGREGVRLDDVRADTPAAQAGLRKGDIIRRINETPVHDLRQYSESLRRLSPGDEIRISIPGGRTRIIEVAELESVNVSKARARELYIDHTPKPTPEEIELRKMQRLSMPTPRPRGAGAPKKGERRRLRRLKEGEEL